MGFEIADQNAVDVPPGLRAAPARCPVADAAWQALTPGAKRGFTHRIHEAKAPATQRRRTDEQIAILTDGAVPAHR